MTYPEAPFSRSVPIQISAIVQVLFTCIAKTLTTQVFEPAWLSERNHPLMNGFLAWVFCFVLLPLLLPTFWRLDGQVIVDFLIIKLVYVGFPPRLASEPSRKCVRGGAEVGGPWPKKTDYTPPVTKRLSINTSNPGFFLVWLWQFKLDRLRWTMVHYIVMLTCERVGWGLFRICLPCCLCKGSASHCA